MTQRTVAVRPESPAAGGDRRAARPERTWRPATALIDPAGPLLRSIARRLHQTGARVARLSARP